MDDMQRRDLKELLVKQLNFDVDTPLQIKKLSGGAIQENWAVSGQRNTSDYEIVLRKNAETLVDVSSDREQEYTLLARLFELGIQVPEPLYFLKKDNFLQSDFFIMNRISGSAEGHKLVRLDNPAMQTKILAQIGQQLAKIHAIKADKAVEAIIEKPNPQDYLNHLIQDFLNQLDKLQRDRPILEFALNWMRQHQPEIDDLVLIHGDFRTGNIMVDGDQISGILDWEFTHWGDRREDIGWFTAKCWRFGQNQNIAGGIGSYKSFMQAYADISDIYIPEFELKFWHVLSHVRWAIIAMQQSNRNQNAEHPSLELALTEFMLPQLEKNILEIIGDDE